MLQFIKKLWPFVLKSTYRKMEKENNFNISRSKGWMELAGKLHRQRANIYKLKNEAEEKQKFAESKQKESEAKQKDLQDQCLRFQMAVERLMKDRYPAWTDLGNKLTKILEGDRDSVLIAYRSEFKIEIKRSEWYPEKRQSIKMIKFSFALGLSEEMPPELISRRIADEVEIAILLQWQNQSILNKI